MERFGNYLRATAMEMKQVSWPTRQTAMVYTALVIGVSVLASIYLGAFDYLFTKLIDIIVNAF